MADVVFIPAKLADLTVDVDLTGAAQGTLLYRGATKWQPLTVGTSGQVLTSAGAGTAPTWQDAPTGGGSGGVTDHGALTGLADDDHPQYHNDTRGDARYLKLAGGTVTGGTTFTNTLRAQGAVTETSVGVDRLDIGVSAGTPRLVFEDAGFTTWQIDNSAGVFRWFTPGVEQMKLATTRFDLNQPAYLNKDVNTHASFYFNANGKTQFLHTGAGTNDTSQDAIRIQPSGTLSSFWRPLAVYLTSAATTPTAYVNSKGVWIGLGHRTTPTALSTGATVNTDASAGDYFRLSYNANFTLAAPSNATDGQVIRWRLKNTGASAITPTLPVGTAGSFRFGSDITGVSDIAAGKTDYLVAIYDGTDGYWDVVGYVKGY